MQGADATSPHPFPMKKIFNHLLFGGVGGSTPLADLGLAVLRIGTGLFLSLNHGLSKISDPSAFINGGVRGSFPAPDVTGWFAILGEFLGGLLLAAGLATRLAGLWIVGVMIGAAFVVHGGSFTGERPVGEAEMALLYLFIALLFALVGSGRFGVDRFLRKP